MNKFLLLILLLQLISSSSYAQELLEIGVQDLKYQRATNASIGTGSLVAKSFRIDIDQFNFEVDEEHELFIADMSYDKNFFRLKSPIVNIGIKIGAQEDLWKLRMVDLKNGEFLYHSDRFSIGGENFSFNLDGTLFVIKNSRVNCKRHQKFREIDIDGIVKNCLNSSTFDEHFINSNQNSFISIQDTETKSPFTIASRIKNIQFEPKSFYILSPESKFKNKDNDITFKNLSARCSKIEFKDKFEPSMLIQGCLDKSDLSISNIDLKNSLIDIDAILKSFQLGGTEFKFHSPKAIAKNQDGTHTIEDLFVTCKKQYNFNSLTVWTILKNCFDKSLHTIKKINLNQRSIENFIQDINIDNPELSIEIDNIERGFDEMRDISLNFAQNKFELKVKFKFLKLSIPGKVKGVISIHEKEQEVRALVDSSKIMGIPMKKIFFHFLKKILKTESVQIKGDMVVIKVK
jgi:hypothetical protein